jgi:hypothetical protein
MVNMIHPAGFCHLYEIKTKKAGKKMTALLPTFYIVLLLASIHIGFVLLATGVVLLLKLKNKLPGGLAITIGAMLTVFPIFTILVMQVTSLIHV